MAEMTVKPVGPPNSVRRRRWAVQYVAQVMHTLPDEGETAEEMYQVVAVVAATALLADRRGRVDEDQVVAMLTTLAGEEVARNVIMDAGLYIAKGGLRGHGSRVPWEG